MNKIFFSLLVIAIILNVITKENHSMIRRTLESLMDGSSNELFNVYEWRISLEKNKIFDQKRLETCEIEMTKLEDEYKRILRLNSKSLMKYVAYKYYKETNKNYFIIQVILKILKY